MKENKVTFKVFEWSKGVGHVALLDVDANRYTSLVPNKKEKPLGSQGGEYWVRKDIPGLEGTRIKIIHHHGHLATFDEDRAAYGNEYRSFFIYLPKSEPNYSCPVRYGYQLADSQKGKGDNHNCMTRVRSELMAYCDHFPEIRLSLAEIDGTKVRKFCHELKNNKYLNGSNI